MTTYYLDATNGNDAYDGLAGAYDGTHGPWQTIAKVNGHSFSAGDSILFYRGDTWREQLTVPSSGSSGNPITFGAYGTGPQPIINGSNLITTWTSAAGTAIDTHSYKLTEDDGGTYNYGWRYILAGGSFSNTGIAVRITVTGCSGQSTTITGMSIGKQASSGDAYDQDTIDRVKITFGGNDGVVLSAGQSVTSDLITYPIIPSNTYVIAYGTQNGYRSEGFHAGTSYCKTNAQADHNTADISKYSAITVTSTISKIEMQYTNSGLANVWNAAVTTQPNVVFTDNIFGIQQSSKAALVADGNWYWSGNVLSLYSTTNPNSRTIEAGTRNYAVYTNNKNYLIFDNIHATKSNGSYTGGFELSYTPLYVTVKNCTADYNYGAGVYIVGSNSDNITVYNCLIKNNEQYGIGNNNTLYTNQNYSYNIIYNNGAHRTDDHYAGIDDQIISGSIHHNTIYNNGAAGPSDLTHGIYHNVGILNSAVNIYNNVIYNHNNGAGIKAGSGANIYNNLIYGNADDGIASGFNSTNNVTLNIYYNIIYGNVTGISVKSIGTGTIAANVYNNIMYNNGASSEFYNDGALTALAFKNNIVYAGASGAVGTIATQSAAAINNNLWYRASGFNMTYGGVAKNWTQWQALGFDAVGLNVDPQFVNPGTDFHLQSSSPGIHAGVNVGLTEDFYGNPVPTASAVDIGAIEYQGVSAAPTVTSFAPVTGPVGTVVTITGTNFTGATAVSFGGTAATSFMVVSATQMTATVPAGAATGKVRVTTPGGYGDSSGSFTLIPAPAITSFAPASGTVGTVVTITGTNFTGATAMSFAGTAATSFTIGSDTQITATVPAGAATGTVSVTTPGGSGTSSGKFTVIPAPAITSFTPVTGPVGTVITITGTNFTGATAVSFGGMVATSFTVVSATQISVTVPAGAVTGKVRVTTPGGYGDSSGNFTLIPAPTVTSFSPVNGPVGTVVTITGTAFTGATAVSFGGTAATSFTVVSATQITATVPAGAATGKVRVTTPGGYGDSSTDFSVIQIFADITFRLEGSTWVMSVQNLSNVVME